jgi:hypothetical protein
LISRSSADPCAFRQLAGVRGGHALVVVAVHHQQRARGEPTGRVDRAEPAQLATPLVEAVREAGRADGTDLASVFEEPARLRGPVVEVRAGAEQRGAADARVVGRHAGGDRAAGVGADQPDAHRAGLGDQMVDRCAQIVDPALQREVALAGTAAAEVERHSHPAQLVGGSVDQLRERACALTSVERADRETVAQDEPGQTGRYARRGVTGSARASGCRR